MNLADYRPTLEEIGPAIGKSGRWIGKMRSTGKMPADGATVAEYIVAWTALATSASETAGIDGHRARLAAAKADQAEMRNAQSRRELLPREQVNAAVQGAFARVRSRMLAIPSKAAVILATIRDKNAIKGKLDGLIHEALAELASTPVEVAGEGAADG